MVAGACVADSGIPGDAIHDSTAAGTDEVRPGWSDLASRVTGRRTFLAFRVLRVDSALSGCDGTGPCARVSMTMPTFPEAETGLQDALHRQVVDLMDLWSEEPGSVPDPGAPLPETLLDAATVEVLAARVAHTFLEGYREFVTDFPDASGEWFLERTTEVEAASPDLMALGMEERTYTGGAHPNSRKRYRTLDPETGAVLSLPDLLRPGFEESLRSAGERAFRRARGLDPDADLAGAGFFEASSGRFELNDNFAPVGDGLAFRFDPYEIAAYAAGPTDLIIPWSEIHELIPTEGPLAHFVGSITRSPGEPQ
jgi:hypothetical protein